MLKSFSLHDACQISRRWNAVLRDHVHDLTHAYTDTLVCVSKAAKSSSRFQWDFEVTKVCEIAFNSLYLKV